jgi:hypothetical protein
MITSGPNQVVKSSLLSISEMDYCFSCRLNLAETNGFLAAGRNCKYSQGPLNFPRIELKEKAVESIRRERLGALEKLSRGIV